MTTTRIEGMPHPHPGHDERISIRMEDRVEWLRAGLAKIPGYSARQIEDMRASYEHHVREHGRDPVIVGVGTFLPTERVWRIGADFGRKSSHAAASLVYRALGRDYVVDNSPLPPPPRERGVVFGLALAGWAS